MINAKLTHALRRGRIALVSSALVTLLTGCEDWGAYFLGGSGGRFEETHQIRVDGVSYAIYHYTPSEPSDYLKAFGVKPQPDRREQDYVLINGRYVPCESDCHKEVLAHLEANKRAKTTLFTTKPGQFKPTNTTGPIEPPGGEGGGGGGY